MSLWELETGFAIKQCIRYAFRADKQRTGARSGESRKIAIKVIVQMRDHA